MVPAVAIEIPAQMCVTVDETGEHRVVSEIIRHGSRTPTTVDATDHALLHDDRRIIGRGATAIDEPAGANRDRRCLRREDCRGREHCQEDTSNVRHESTAGTLRGISAYAAS